MNAPLKSRLQKLTKFAQFEQKRIEQLDRNIGVLRSEVDSMDAGIKEIASSNERQPKGINSYSRPAKQP